MGKRLRRVGLAFALVMGTLVGMVVGLTGSVAHAADLVVPINTVVSGGTPGVEYPLVTGYPTGAIEGRLCTATAVGLNQPSVHPGNNLRVSTGGASLILENVEQFPSKVTGPVGPILMGSTVDVVLIMGPDDFFSAGMNIEFDCEPPPPPPPPPPSATAVGECVQEVFQVKVTNTGTTQVSGSIVGYGTFDLAPQAMTTADITDRSPGDTVTVTFDQDIDDIGVTVQDCSQDEEPPTATATGECVGEVFQVTVTNTGTTPVSGSVDGTEPFDLDPQEAQTFDIPDPSGDTITVTFEQDIDPVDIPVEDCAPPPPPPPPPPTASATGLCEGDVFQVKVTNTGTSQVSGSIVGYDEFDLDPGEMETFDITDREPGDMVTVTFDQEIPEEDVEVLDCTEPFVTFEALVPVCLEDIPYIAYDAAVSDDLAGSLADIRLLDLNGVEVANYPQQPLQGVLIWPGASADPEDWPGWRLNEDGFWVLDPTDDFLRDGIIVEVTVNPTVRDTVSYPPATEACNGPITTVVPGNIPPPPVQPPGNSPPPPPAPPSNLPVTGDETEVMMLIALLLLGIGGSLVGVSRRTAR